MYGTIVTLQQHLTDTGCHTEVTVNLEGRMGIKQIGIGTSVGILSHLPVFRQNAEHILDNQEGMVAVQQTSPQIGLPPQAPTCCLVTTLCQCGGSSRIQVGMRKRRYLIGGVQPIEVRHMTMLVVGIVTVPQPLLQLTMLTNLHGRQLSEGSGKTADVRGIFAKDTGGLGRLTQHVEDNLVVHGRACRHRRMLADRAMLR